jgi:hypothetical protein
VIVPVPPVAEAVADPSLPPLQLTLVDEVIDTLTEVAGSVMVTVSVSSHPLASVTVTVYVPADKPLTVAPVPELFHA